MSTENNNNENVQEKKIEDEKKVIMIALFLFAILLMVVFIYTNRLNRKIIKMQNESLGIYIGILCLCLVLIWYCIYKGCVNMKLLQGLIGLIIGLSIFAEMGTLIASIYKINRNELVDDTLSSNEIEKILKTNRILISVYSISIGIYGLYEFRNFSRRDCITTNEYNML